MKILKVNPVVESIKNIEEPNAVIGYGYDKDTEIWRTILWINNVWKKLISIIKNFKIKQNYTNYNKNLKN